MIINFLLIIIFLVLFISSYLDIKYRAVPSVILTATLFLVIILRPENLIYGVLAFVFAILIQDFLHDSAGMEFGTADIKVFAIIGMLIPSTANFLLMLVIFLGFQLVYTIIYTGVNPQPFVGESEPLPFLPCLFAVYITMWIVGGVL